MEISFKTKEQPESRKVNFDMPADLDALRAKFGDDSVYAAATGAYVISLQALARRHIEKSDEEIQELVTNWNPNERAPAVKQTPFERAAGALGKLTPEERQALMAKLQAAA
jgi:hypothetical protein